MAQIRLIPDQNGRITQNNSGEIYGNVSSSFNVDLYTNKGRVLPSTRLIPLSTSVEDSDMGLPVAFLYNVNKWWAYCGQYIFSNDGTATGAFTQDTTTNSPTGLSASYGDAVIFNGDMIFSHQDGLFRRRGGGINAWTSGDWWKGASNLNQAQLNVNYNHPLGVSLFSNLLCVGDKNLMHTVTTDGTVTNPRLTLAPEQVIQWIVSSSTRVWIGCVNELGGEGLVYEWNGGANLPSRAYRIGSTGTCAAVIKDDIPYIITSDGSLKKYNGSGFSTVAVFPVKNKKQLLKNSTTFYYDKFIHPRGIGIVDDTITMLVGNQLENSTYEINPDMPAGIWKYDDEKGLHHVWSPSLTSAGTLDFGQFASSADSAFNNGVKGGFCGAIAETKQTGSTLFAGFSWFTGNETGRRYGIFREDIAGTITKRTRVITPWLYGPQLTNAWNKIGLIYRRFANSDDRIIVKYRPRKKDTLPFQASVTWTNNTTFTSTNTAFNNVSVGDEVFVIMGNGSGASAHVSSISETTPSWTVVLDEAIPGVSAADTGKVQVDNWKKVTTISDQFSDHEERQIPDQSHSPRMQFLIEMRSGGGKTPELERFLVELKEQI